MYTHRLAGARAHRVPRVKRDEGATAAALVTRAVRAELERGPAVLAVSGGRDSMVLLEAAARVAPDRVAAVATFDHGTGAAATRAASLVEARARSLGLEVRRGLSHTPAATEAEWRAQRMEFLRAISRELGAHIVTAHTLDDHIETVLMRALRGSGARGLAGLLAPSSVGRPLLALTRSAVGECARAWRVSFVDDPTNVSRLYFRNRVRLDLLPALARVRPELTSELVALSRRAAALRVDLDDAIDAGVEWSLEGSSLVVARDDLVGFGASELALIWPALAARQGVTLDRRGTERLVSFTIQGAPGARIQLSGGVEAMRQRDRLLVRRVPRDVEVSTVRLEHGARWGDWRFVRHEGEVKDRWSAVLRAGEALSIRAWRPGDRMIPEGSTEPRRLKGLFRDAGVDAVRRRAWPVVVAGDEVVWVPGVRRSLAAPARSGRPIVTFRCEHIDR